MKTEPVPLDAVQATADWPARGRFLSFEGIDGAGKSTHIAGLAAHLRACGIRVVLTREPGGTPLAESLREKLLHEPMDARTEALLMFAARSDHVARVIEPALSRGDWVLCDRFTDATFAYQGYGRDFDLHTLSKLEQITQQILGHSGKKAQKSASNQAEEGLLQPEATFWFDLAPEIAAVRLAGARVPDKFESQPTAFFERVRTGYRARADADPARIAVIDASGTPEQVFARLMRAAASRDWWPTSESGAAKIPPA